ncbi:MAG TPA: glycosyltransferase family 4 protein [Candidatus Binataceae bacterium]|nr:glycosyltransferase family 4 protein [Candidatus Binataceae bacterium]
MNILFLSEQYPPRANFGGIGSYLACIAPALARRGHNVHVLCIQYSLESGNEIFDGVNVHWRRLSHLRGSGRLPFSQILHRLNHARAAFFETRRLKVPFDVIEFPEWNAPGAAFALFGDAPTVAHLHSGGIQSGIDYNGIKRNFDTRITAWFERLIVRRANVVTAPSVFLADKVVSWGWFDRDRIHVVPPAIDYQIWSDTRLASETEPRVQFVGWLDQRKAPEVLVDAIKELRLEIPDAHACFAGGGPSADFRRPDFAWAPRTSYEGCTFSGLISRDSVKDVLGSCRVLAVTSRFESFSLAALEAMAAGRPVVVTATVGIADFVRETGAGEVVPAGDAQALANALAPFLRDPAYAAFVGERARRAIRTRLAPERIAELRERIYHLARQSWRRKPADLAGATRTSEPSGE